jgi:hypothetical protein
MSSFEGQFLRKNESYFDVSVVISLDSGCVTEALGRDDGHLGPLLPAVKLRVVGSVRASNVLEPSHREAVLQNEP